MDYESLIYAAKRNEQKKKEPVKWLPTKFKAPTREQKDKEKVLSEGVLKFLAKKEEEEKKKQLDAQRQKEELLALRAQDPKAKKRIQTMLKRTKSANKSVMADAIDNNNTADTLAGPIQPDDDDYGFVSEVASAAYQKLMQKMYNNPDDSPSFAPKKKPTGGNLSNTKERVKMALIKEKEDELLPRKRKRKEKEKGESNDVELDFSAPDRDYKSERSDRGKEEKPKIRKPMPPPMDFHELLKIAERKQHEPVTPESTPKRIEEPEMLMTKKQRQEYEKLQEYRRRRKERENGTAPISQEVKEEKKIPKQAPEVKEEKKIPKQAPDTSSRIPKLKSDPKPSGRPEQKTKTDDRQKENVKNKTESVHRKVEKRKNANEDEDDELETLRRERDEAMRILEEKEKLIREKNEVAKRMKEKEKLIRERDEAMRKLKMFEKEESKTKRSPEEKEKIVVKKLEQKKVNNNQASKETEKRLVNGTKNGLLTKDLNQRTAVREFPPKDLAPREFPPKDLAPREFSPKDLAPREFPPRDLKQRPQTSRQFPPPDVRRKLPPSKRRRIDESDEHDSELDDFIDDGPEGGVGQEDVSRVISEIFNYDRNKYSRFEDDECEESNFARISKEEYHSAKLGLLEDLEDMQQERREKEMKKKRIIMMKRRVKPS